MTATLVEVRCRICHRLLFKAAGLGRVEIVCPDHRGNDQHRRPQLVPLRRPAPPR
jgi:hypothetical protein